MSDIAPEWTQGLMPGNAAGRAPALAEFIGAAFGVLLGLASASALVLALALFGAAA